MTGWVLAGIFGIGFLILYIMVVTNITRMNKEKAEQEKERLKRESEEMTKRGIEKDQLYNKIIDLQEKQIEKPQKQKREYTAEEKREYANRQREFKKTISQKGKDYEEFTANHYRSSGYEVLEHGKEYGKLDKGIDLIAKKEKEVIFIQCKNWKADGKVKIDHVKIKEFIGNVATFLEKNTVYKDYEVKRIFAVAEPVLDKSAIEYIKANKKIVRYLHLPMP
jgi:Holliday junction resolvase-like predicted endonuclease